MKRMSIKLKVTLWYTIVMVIVSSIVLVTMNSISNGIIRRDIHERMFRAVEMMSRWVEERDGNIQAAPKFFFFQHGVHMAVFDSEYNLLGGQPPFGITMEVKFKEERAPKLKTFAGESYYILDREIKTETQTMWLRAVMSEAGESFMLKSTFKINLILTLVLIFIAALGGYFIVGRALAPVERISRTAKIISKSSDLTRRINIGDGKDEIYSLANTFDDMLDRLEKNFEREKQFTSDASHELRTPVAVIMSECEYMSECAKTPDDFRESADSVKRQADKMSKLISELLTISRMDKKTMPLNFEETDISELLSFVCDEQEELFGTEIIMEREIAPEVFAKVDKSCIARLFINLISNAYRYSFDGGKISVKLSETNSEIVFSVKDNGIGIDEKEQEKIWERFYQVDTARTASGGVGLGLSMVKWIAENHGGKVSVASKPGEGSEFTVVLPKNI